MKVLRPRVNRRSARLLFCWRDWSRRARLGLSAQLQVYEPRRLGFGSAGDWTDASVPVNGGFGTVCEWEHQVMQLHPIMYVADQYAERSFYELFGFERVYEGEEFPGFLALRHGEAVIGLQRASSGHPAYSQGLRWQFELDTADQLEQIITVCRAHGLEHEVVTERGGDRFVRRLVTVVSPGGVTVWFEGADEAGPGGD